MAGRAPWAAVVRQQPVLPRLGDLVLVRAGGPAPTVPAARARCAADGTGRLCSVAGPQEEYATAGCWAATPTATVAAFVVVRQADQELRVLPNGWRCGAQVGIAHHDFRWALDDTPGHDIRVSH